MVHSIFPSLAEKGYFSFGLLASGLDVQVSQPVRIPHVLQDLAPRLSLELLAVETSTAVPSLLRNPKVSKKNMLWSPFSLIIAESKERWDVAVHVLTV